MSTEFPNAAAEFVYVRTYSRWIEEEQRREFWPETVERFIDFIEEERGDKIPSKVLRKIKEYMLNLEVMPSMRTVWAAGEAAKMDNTCMYNCSFQVIDTPRAFSECLYILMCGTGYGFSVESKYVNKLPTVQPMSTTTTIGIYEVKDSKRGWADSVKVLVQALYDGKDIEIGYSKIRTKGSRLITMGGRASGPEPLIALHNFLRETFHKAQGRKLYTLEVHDIMNQIAEIVVVGGVRRSSEISLSDLGDEALKNSKIWPFPLRRAMANNSAVYLEKPSAVEFLQEWSALAASGTGERGIFNLDGARKNAPKRRRGELIAGTNPCGEISLRSEEFCNLSEVVVRAGDDLDDLLDKVETATWLGVIQSTFTRFPYLSKKWAKNCEEERLLGVSLTGQMDNLECITPDNLKALKAKAIKVARRASVKMEVSMPVAITCVKPSGSVSQLVDSASGLHPRFSKFGIRRYRISATDPLLKLLQSQDIPVSPENGQRKEDWAKAVAGNKDGCTIYKKGEKWSPEKVTTWVVSFPIASPEGAVTRDQISAIKQLEHYKMLQQYWCEHNASCTVYVKDEEWFEVGNWVYRNWDLVNGVSFLPFEGGHYEQAPYEEITEVEYEKLKHSLPKIDYSQLKVFETEDNTEGAKSLACTGDACELD